MLLAAAFGWLDGWILFLSFSLLLLISLEVALGLGALSLSYYCHLHFHLRDGFLISCIPSFGAAAGSFSGACLFGCIDADSSLEKGACLVVVSFPFPLWLVSC